MNEKICPICNNESFYLLTKEGAVYFQCFSCKTIFCDEVPNDGMIGGGFELERNTRQNHIRLERVAEMTIGMKREDVNILDFGCGHFMLGEELIKAGYNCDGYDMYNEKYSRLPIKDKYHIVLMVEVLEHMVSDFIELDVIHRSLKDKGLLYLESGMVNTAVEDNISFQDWFYLNPLAGHNTIFSHHSTDVIMLKKGFTPTQHFCRNSRLFRKIKK